MTADAPGRAGPTGRPADPAGTGPSPHRPSGGTDVARSGAVAPAEPAASISGGSGPALGERTLSGPVPPAAGDTAARDTAAGGTAPVGTAPGGTAAGDKAAGDIAERRLHPAYLLISGGRMARGLIPLIAVGVWRLPGWTFAVCGVLVAVYAIGARWSRRYSVAHGVLTVRSGVLRRTEHTIPVSRITSLDARRGLVQRLLRVWALRVITPSASEHPAMELVCLSTDRLAELRTALARPGSTAAGADPPAHRNGAAPVDHEVTSPSDGTADSSAGGTTDRTPDRTAGGTTGRAGTSAPITDPAPSGVLIAVLGRRELAVATATGVSVPLIFAGGAAAWGRVRELVPRDTLRAWEQRVFGPGSATVLILLGVAVVAVLLGSLLTAQRMARFTLTRDGDRLRTSRGLISQRVDTVMVDRVMAVRIVQGVLRRACGYCALEVEVAGHGRNDAQDRTLFPLVRADRVEQLVQAALPELRWQPGPLTPAPRRSRRRYLTVPVLLGVAGTAALLLLPHWWALLAVAPLPMAVAVGWTQARVAGWRLDSDTVTVRSHAVLSRSTTVARTARVTLTRTSTTVFQRRAALAGVHLTLSSRRRVSMRHLDEADALLLLHRVGRRRRPDRVAARTAGAGHREPYRG